MEFLEKDLEEIIFNSFNEDKGKLLREKGLDIEGKIFRKFRIGNYGICDLLTVEKDYECIHRYKYLDKEGKPIYKKFFFPVLKFTIYELKKDKIGISAMLQSLKYIRGIQRYLKLNNPYLYEQSKFEIVLIGKTLDASGSFYFMPELFNNIKMYTYKYEMDGLRFKENRDYKLINEGFKKI